MINLSVIVSLISHAHHYIRKIYLIKKYSLTIESLESIRVKEIKNEIEKGIAYV